jgi:hypothetical protein
MFCYSVGVVFLGCEAVWPRIDVMIPKMAYFVNVDFQGAREM